MEGCKNIANCCTVNYLSGCSLIEAQANVEKGLCHRFLWLVPQPTIVKFDQLQQVDALFMVSFVFVGAGVLEMAFTIHWFPLSRTDE